MTYAFRPLQHQQVAQSFGAGAEEERHPPIDDIKKIGKDLFVLQIYIDDIIFGSTN